MILILRSQTVFYYLQHRLIGWCTSPDASEGTYYAVNTLVRNLTDVPNGTIHLYAIWNSWRGTPPEPESSDPPAPTYTKSYTYDLAGNRTGFTLMQGSETIQELTYTYDTLNRLSSVRMDNVTQASYTYDTGGNHASLTYPNGGWNHRFVAQKMGQKNRPRMRKP